MAYSIQPGSILEVIVWGEIDLQTTMSVFHYKLGGMTSIADGRSVCQQVITNLGAAGGLFDQYAQCCSNDITFTLTSAQWIKSLRYARYDQLPTYTTGTVASDALPSNLSVALTKRSNSEIGRHAHGTLHMPGVPSSFVEGGTLTVAANTQYLELCAEVRRQANGGGGSFSLDPVIYQRGNPPESVIIDGCEPQYNVRTMRRRTVGRGI